MRAIWPSLAVSRSQKELSARKVVVSLAAWRGQSWRLRRRALRELSLSLLGLAQEDNCERSKRAL